MRFRLAPLVPLLLMVAACAGADDPSAPDTSVASTGGLVPPNTALPAPTPDDESTTSTGATSTTSPPESTSTTLPPLSGLEYSTVAEVPFPIMLTARPGDEFALLALRGGQVLRFDGGEGETVLDLSDRTTTDGERGLLGLARHPEDDGRLFVHYTDRAGDTVVSEFSLDGSVADAGSEEVLLQVAQPAANHNGGMIQFGPDGALYLGLGDGGASGDRFGNGQNPDTLLGGIVRIDVDTAESELWHLGLRNPWRFWIDGEEIWIADVGQSSYEEVDLADITQPGVNYGWPILEGEHCFQTDPCDATDLTPPLIEIARGDAGTCSITGGVTYRGTAIPELEGEFLFSDYCGGYLRSVDNDGRVDDHTDEVGALDSVVSFGVDGEREAYVLTTDRVLRLSAVR